MISLKNFERLQELQQQIVWQSVLELEPRSLVPEASIFDFIIPEVKKKLSWGTVLPAIPEENISTRGLMSC